MSKKVRTQKYKKNERHTGDEQRENELGSKGRPENYIEPFVKFRKNSLNLKPWYIILEVEGLHQKSPIGGEARFSEM